MLLLFVTIAINIAYWYYCHKKLIANRFILKSDKKLLVELTSFSGWNLFGGLADVGYKQGTNIILNLFFGVTVNAALGITNQIRNAIFSFVGNLQLAANPQIVKSYATGEYHYFTILVHRISKYSYFLMLLLTFPIIFNIDLILKIWLKKTPEYTATFAVLTLVFCLIDSLTGPLWVAMQAGGKIQRFQIITSICLLLNLPISYMFLVWGYSPYSVLAIQIIITVVTLGVRLLFVKYYLRFSICSYLSEVLLPVILVTLFSIPVPLYICFESDGYTRLFLTVLFMPIMAFIVYLCGTCKSERIFVKQLIKRKISKK